MSAEIVRFPRVPVQGPPAFSPVTLKLREWMLQRLSPEAADRLSVMVEKLRAQAVPRNRDG
jgi:hypothetical protein